MTRRVVVIFGPPGAGKTTMAHTLGLDVYDRDDARWDDNEGRFREALRRLARDPHAQAVVIRTGATEKARAWAIDLCKATEVHVLDVPESVCIERVKQRARGNVGRQIAAVTDWWAKYRAGGRRRRTL